MRPEPADRDQRVSTRDNLVQSVLILMGLGVLLCVCAFVLAGVPGLMGAAALSAGSFVLAPRVPAEVVMRIYRATRVAPDDSQLSSLIDVLAWRARLERRPDLYIVPSMTLNAFSAGTTDRPVIALSEGLVRRLTLREIAGVVAHEMAHIRNGDLSVMALADVVTRILQGFSVLALGMAAGNAYLSLVGRETLPWLPIILLYLAPAVSNLLQLALSRTREFEADHTAAQLTGDPMGLASAIDRVETYTGHFWEDLLPPVAARRVPQPSLLRTHPPSAERIQRLLTLGRRPAPDPLVIVERPMMSLVGMGPAALKPRYRWPGVWF